MWTCIKCNTEVDEENTNCPTCGSGRNGLDQPPAGSKLLSVIIVIVVIIVLLFVAFWK